MLAQVRDQELESFEGERARAPPFADRRDERVVGAKARHRPSVAR